MTGYEQDFIYKTLRRLTNAIEGLTKEIKRYNDSKDRDIEMEWIDEHRLKLDKVEKPIDNNKYNEIPKEKLNDLKYVNAIKAAKKEKDKEEEEEEHDCKSCEFAPICMLLDIFAKDKK